MYQLYCVKLSSLLCASNTRQHTSAAQNVNRGRKLKNRLEYKQYFLNAKNQNKTQTHIRNILLWHVAATGWRGSPPGSGLSEAARRAEDESPHYNSVCSHRHKCQSLIAARVPGSHSRAQRSHIAAAAAAAVNLIIASDSACDRDVPRTASHSNTGITLMLKAMLTSLL